MADEQITLTIDDQSVTVPKGTKIVDAAKTVGIEIPVFCYHEKLGPLGCCRMCLVEVEKMPKLMTACTMDVGPEMVVKTTTPKVVKAQEGVLEFTLLNHPLDCPVCDKGGECPLQDNTFKYGPGDTRMEFNRAHNDKANPLSPVITIDRERCIACQRCTRYSEVIEQDQTLVMNNRGFNNEVGTFNNEPYETRFSGNVIDICPVGALTNTEFRFKARTWDLTNSDTLCAHCGCNCNMTLGVRTNKFMRIESRPNDLVDDGWICDKARWGHDFLEGKNRIREVRGGADREGTALSVLDGGVKTPSVKDAVERTALAIKKIVDAHGPESVGFIGSPYGTNEELYLYQKLFRSGFGTNNIDHKVYADSPGLPVDHFDLSDIESSDLVLMIASDPTEELPILDLRIKKVVSRKGVKLAVLNDQSTLMDKYAHLSLRYNIGTDAQVFSALAGCLSGNDSDAKDTGIEAEPINALAKMLKTNKKVTVVYNPAALTGQSVHVLKHLLTEINKVPDIELGAIPSAPHTNAVGALDMGVVPDYYPGGVSLSDGEAIKKQWGEATPLAPGLTAMEMIQKAASGDLKALIVYRANPVVDFPGGKQVATALRKVDLLVVHDICETETTKLAKIVLPSNGPGYDEGTTTNIGGRVQYRKGGLKTTHPPDWKIIAMMAQALGEESNYITSFSVTDEIGEKVRGYDAISKKSIKKEGLSRTASKSRNGASPDAGQAQAPKGDSHLKLRIANYLFAHDKILDASSTLAHQFKTSVVHLHEQDAKKLGLKNDDEVIVVSGEAKVEAQVEISNRCNPGGVVLPRISDEQGLLELVNGADDVNWVEIRKN
jgi:NADH-quinone oxidoreductase subunit G